MPINFRKGSPIPDILVLYKDILKPSEWQTISGYRVTTPSRTLFDIISSQSISEEFVSQTVREGFSRGLFPKQKLKQYKLFKTINPYMEKTHRVG